MAGSGKSLLTASFSEWIKLKGQDVITLNLDPGALSLPYNPDVDVRDYVDVTKLMEEYELGPNGALIMAADLIGDHMEEIREGVEETKSDIVLVDTPGQIELFAFRESGPFISHAITEDPKAVLYLLDAPFCRNPLNYVSNIFMAAAVYNRLLQPQVYALTKSDLISERELDEILTWSEEVEELEYAVESRLGKTVSLISRDLMRAVWRIGLIFEPVPVSAKNMSGFVELYAALTRTLTGGEEPQP
jgi:GTPase SAR1 family protein